MRRIELLREQLIQKNQLDEASCSLLDEIQAELVLGEKSKPV